MNERVKPKMRKRSNLFSESRKVAVSLLSVFLVFIFVNTFFYYPSFYSNSVSLHPNLINFRQSFDFWAKLSEPKVYMYLLPENFTDGVIKQHMPEWYIISDLTRPGNERVGSPIFRVFNPAEADLFFVSGFSSGQGDVEMQESLMGWLESQEWWMKNNGRDHVIVVGDPNALKRVMDRVKNAVLLVTGFGRLRVDQGSLVKDVIIPCAHRTNAYEGELGVENRNTLLFFMGNRYHKDGGRFRDKVLKLLENEDDVVIKHGSQSELKRRAAKQGIHTSKFCLHLTGDTISVYKVFDSIASFCVPVIVSDGIELPFEDIIDYRKFSIFLRTDAALKPGVVVKKLRKVKPGKILKYQKAMKEVRRYFNYTHPNGSVNEIWRQVTQKIPLIKLMINRERRMIKREVNEPQCSCLCSNRTSTIDGGL